MATSTLQDLCLESTCTICLAYFQHPVTIECGHNFCQACLVRYCEDFGGEKIPCPQCRGRVQKKFIPNWQLANFVELTRKLVQGEQKEGICGKHQEPLKLFCKDDDVPICIICEVSKEHKYHDVAPVQETVQDNKSLISYHLEHLEKKKEMILAYKVETEEIRQEFLNSAKEEEEEIKEQFIQIHFFLDKKQKLLQAKLEDLEKLIAEDKEEYLASILAELSFLTALIFGMNDIFCHLPTKTVIEKMRTHFGDLKIILRTDEILLLRKLKWVKEKIAKESDEHMARLSEKFSSLEGLIQEMKEKCQQPPGELMQDVGRLLERCEEEEMYQFQTTYPSELNVQISYISKRSNSLVELNEEIKRELLSTSTP